MIKIEYYGIEAEMFIFLNVDYFRPQWPWCKDEFIKYCNKYDWKNSFRIVNALK